MSAHPALLFKRVTAFRMALENSRDAANGRFFLGVMARFPTGCCKVASMLLARYLCENAGISPSRLFLAANGRRDQTTHAWLEINDHIVDITADQFDASIAPVVVTSDHHWHSSFRDRKLYPSYEFMHFNDAYAYDFDDFYKTVLRNSVI